MSPSMTEKNTEDDKALNVKGIVAENRKLAKGIYEMTIRRPIMAAKSWPGQFISILCGSALLRRPFSIAGVSDDSIKILYKIKGEGTIYLSKLNEGASLDMIGPLGNGFALDSERALLIGAGVGVAPLLFLDRALREHNNQTRILAGFATNIKLDELQTQHCRVVTEDASTTTAGIITEYIEEEVKTFNPDKVYACGPNAVLEYAVKMAKKHNVEIEVALEEKFACGIGVCMGCIIEVLENDERVNKRICKDGPVFKGEVVLWQ